MTTKIEATNAKEKELDLCGDGACFELTIEAAEGGEAKKNRRFSIVGYSGGLMRLRGWYDPVVVDLQGMSIDQQSKPVYLQHVQDIDYLVGQSDSIKIVNNQLVASGDVFAEGDKAKQVIALADKGFKWQASIGARAEESVILKANEKMTVNGQEVEGPATVVTRSSLGEISFVMLGADEETSASIAAKSLMKESGMPKLNKKEDDRQVEEKVEAAAPNAEVKTEEKKVEASAAITEVKTEDPVQAQVEHIRAAAAQETERIAEIGKVCAGEHAEIQAKAVKEGWSRDRTELEVLRASRPSAPAIHMRQVENLPSVLEAAAMMAGGVRGDDLLKSHGEQVVAAADRRYRRIGLQQLIMEAARANGCSVMYFRDDMRQVLEAAFSTFDVSGILSNIANKFLLAGFESVEKVWRAIAATRPVNDFKQITSYRLSGGFEYEEVGPDGELKHGKLGETTFTNKAKTYGKMFGITRQDLINDDLGALTAVPRRIGRGGHLKLNSVFWAEFLNNAAFFTSGNKNYAEGAATALGIDGLTAAELLFLDQTDDDGNPLAVQPRTLLVPNALKVLGTQLTRDLELRDTTASKKYTTSNPHAGKWQCESSAYIKDSVYAWYLLADPQDLPVIEVVFLNGVENPTVESADADFNTLGIQMRGYFDFGVSKQDPKGGVKMKGTA